MNNFGKQLQNYAQGNSDKCLHPIKWVDDNRLCHQCNQYVPIREYKISEIEQLHARIAELTAFNESMQTDARKNTETIRTLKQELDALKACKHMHVKIHSRLYRPSTREEPAEYEYKAECKDCKEWFSADDVDEWAEVEE